ncbi:MAG: hypothetical protein ACREQE_09680, partial [Candidatus Binataceae bacterium]
MSSGNSCGTSDKLYLSMMVKFPSTDYFDALKLRMQAEEQRFRRLGFIDTSFGLVIGENGVSIIFVLSFE